MERKQKTSISAYPFFLQIADSYTRVDTEKNQFLFNAGSKLSENTGNYEMFFREYDPVLGRMTAVDPMAGKYRGVTPYNYAFNTPLRLNDPSGAEPHTNPDKEKEYWERFWAQMARMDAMHDAWTEGMTPFMERMHQGDSYLVGGRGSSSMMGTQERMQNNMRAAALAAANGVRSDDLTALMNYGRQYGVGESDLSSEELQDIADATGLAIKDGKLGWYFQGETFFTGSETYYSGKSGLGIDLKTANVGAYFRPLVVGGGFTNQNKGNNYDPGFGHSLSDWVDVAAAELMIFGTGFDLSSWEKPRNMNWDDFKVGQKIARGIARRLSVAGAVISVSQAINNPTGGNMVDAVFGVVGAIPGVGTAIGGAYFTADLFTMGITGKGISNHIDGYIWIPNPAGNGFIPVTKISGK